MADDALIVAGILGELRRAADAAAPPSGGLDGAHGNADALESDLAGYYAAATVVVVPTIGARACGSLASAEA